jgi:hypothetical protein
MSGTSGLHVSNNDLPTGFLCTDCNGNISSLGSFWHFVNPGKNKKIQIKYFPTIAIVLDAAKI